LALGVALTYFVLVNPVLFEFYSVSGQDVITVTLTWTYELFDENQIVQPFPNYWLIGGFYGVVMVWFMALMSYNRPKVQLYSTLALAGILVAYGIEIQVTYWVYHTKYYVSSVFEGRFYWGAAIMYVIAILALFIAFYLFKRKRA